MVLKPTQGRAQYDPGDHVGVLASNPREMVTSVLRRVRNSPAADAPVRLLLRRQTGESLPRAWLRDASWWNISKYGREKNEMRKNKTVLPFPSRRYVGSSPAAAGDDAAGASGEVRGPLRAAVAGPAVPARLLRRQQPAGSPALGAGHGRRARQAQAVASNGPPVAMSLCRRPSLPSFLCI